jgi:nucleoside-diphosphate-sugar epimerase
VHLAAYYDCIGLDHPEYMRTNVGGLRNVLDACTGLPLRRFILASSLAACRFPTEGLALTESSPADGEHIHARTKRLGEEMLNQYQQAFPTVTVRLAALFSGWCEYPPLFVQLNAWFSKLWNADVIAGRGLTAIPYLRVHDVVTFLRRLPYSGDELTPGEIVIASGDGAVSRRELVRRFREGFSADEFCGAVELLNLICMRILRRDPASGGMRQPILDYLNHDVALRL